MRKTKLHKTNLEKKAATRNEKDLPGIRTLASKFEFPFKCLTRRLPHREAIEATVTFIFLQHFTSWSRIVASFATVEIFLGIWCLEISMSLQKQQVQNPP